MTLETWFWLCMALWALGGVGYAYWAPAPNRWPFVITNVFPFIAILIVGWSEFGDPVK